MTNEGPRGQYESVPPDCDAERRAAILSDVPRFRVERLRLLAAIDASTDAGAIEIWLRRVDKIEERFSEVGLRSDGIEHVL